MKRMNFKNKILYTIILFHLTCNQELMGQTHIVIIDSKLISTQIPTNGLLTKGRDSLIEHFTGIFTSCTNQLNKEIQYFTKGCPSFKQQRKFEVEVFYKYNKLFELEELMDSLISLYDLKSKMLINKQIIESLREYLKIHEIHIDYIFNKGEILFCDNELDFTDEVLEMLTKKTYLESMKNESKEFVDNTITESINKVRPINMQCFGEIPENIEIETYQIKEAYRKKLESRFLVSGARKIYKYLKN